MKDMKRPYRTPGNVVLIPLSDGKYTYGRVINAPLMAFYDLRSAEILPVEEVVKSRVLFKIWVMNSAISKHHWRVLGNLPLENELIAVAEFYKWDMISKKFSVYEGDGQERPATLEECTNLECAAVWSAEHVESRLEDHFAGRENKWVNSLKATTQFERGAQQKRA